MKIVYIYPQMVERAGTERILSDKMNYLAEQAGYEIVLLTYEQCSRPLAFPLSPKIRHVDLDMRYYLYYRYNLFVRLYKWRQLEKVLQSRYDSFMEEFLPDIVITTTSYVRPVVMVSRCTIPCVRILESHIDRRYIMNNAPAVKGNLKEWCLGFLDMRSLTKSARRFDLLVTLNQSDADDWSRFVKSKVITNMVHLNPLDRLSPLTDKHVIFVGRYTIQKGVPDLLKIWKKVHDRHSDWHLDLYGQGDMKDEITTLADKLHANIHVHDSDPSIFERYLESSVFVLTSLYEPFGLVIPEAMSCGLPVVVFDCPYGPAQIIKDGEDGFLVSNRDSALFVDRVCQLIESKELRMQMGKAAAQSAQCYSAELVMPQWVELFVELSSRNLSSDLNCPVT